MVEEMKNASREAPKAIITSVYIGAVTGFVFLISVSFCIGDIDSTASSTTGVPLIQIFYDSTGSVVGTCFLTSLIVVIFLVAVMGVTAEGSRSLFAFARDNGLPFSKFFSKVESKRNVPVHAVFLAAAIQMALCSIYFGTVTGFNTVLSIATEGFYLSYAMPLLARVISWFLGNFKVLPGPFSLGRYGIWMNLIGLVFLVFTSVTFNFPTVSPVDSDNMNYTSAAIGVVALISIVTWITTGRSSFTGPQIGPVFEGHLGNDSDDGKVVHEIVQETKG